MMSEQIDKSLDEPLAREWIDEWLIAQDTGERMDEWLDERVSRVRIDSSTN
jgi:hypothetical protein